jgi:AAA+ ATPase superfamily predicted ATPase
MLSAVPFVDREEELAFLRRAFARKDAQLLILYGRRRVGKTSLLQHFAAESPVPSLYHVAAQTTVKEELSRFSKRLSEFFADPLPGMQPFASWESVLEYLGQKARQADFGWMLDEMPYAVEGDRSLPSILQAAWDGILRHTGIKLVLCGSSIGMIEEIGLLPSSPLFGRRTGQWKLEPFAPDKLALLWPSRSLGSVLEAYGIVGGSPLYITRFDRGASLLLNIRDHILTKGEILYDEVPFLLREEVRDARVYQSILSSIAQGARKFSELSSRTGLDKAHLTRYLAILGDLGLVRREVPVTEHAPEKSRKGIYGIQDPFVSFWYRYVFPNRDRLEGGAADHVLREIVEPTLDSYLSGVLEPAIGSLFRTRWRRLIPFEPAAMGRHWSGTEELDWVILDNGRRKAVAVEIKWSAKAIPGRQVMEDLKRRASSCRGLEGSELTTVVIARKGFSDRPRRAATERFIDLRKEKVAP